MLAEGKEQRGAEHEPRPARAEKVCAGVLMRRNAPGQAAENAGQD